MTGKRCYDGGYEKLNHSNQIPLKTETVRKIDPEPEPARLASDLEVLRGKALEAGAAEASIIDAGQVVFDPAVARRVEVSTGYVSFHWPLVYPKDSVQEAVAAFQKGIFFRLATNAQMFPQDVGGPRAEPGEMFPEHFGGPIADPAQRDLYYKVYGITAAVESAAFYQGHHLALGFAAGNCRAVFCTGEPGCQARKKGRPCLHPYQARPSLEAAGMNARQMARELGWKDVPGNESGFLCGLVLVY